MKTRVVGKKAQADCRRASKWRKESNNISNGWITKNGELSIIEVTSIHSGIIFFGGDAANDILSWYLEDKCEMIQCTTESNNSNPEFDVMMYENDIPVCSIELKRLATTNQICAYLEEFPIDCGRRDDFNNYLFINIYPTNTIETANTAFDLVGGYGRLSPHVSDFYSQENVHVANIPAPLNYSEEIEPLRLIRQTLRNEFNI